MYFEILLLWVSTLSKAQEYCPSKYQPQILRSSETERQYLYTPGFKFGRYAINLDCHWIIQSSNPRNRIDIYIWFSHLEDRLFTDCDDFMEIKDGSTFDSAIIVQWCGTFNPLTVTSTSDSLYVHFKSDLAIGNFGGVNMSFEEHSLLRCPDQWMASLDQVMCYRMVSPLIGSTWIQAQSHCAYERSNLLTISNREEYQTVFNMFATKNDFPWIGVYDAKEEETFINIDRTPRTWPALCSSSSNDGLCFPAFPKHDSKDCLYLDFIQSGIFYGIDDCRIRRSFICKKRRDGTTVPYAPTQNEINQGFIETAGYWSPMYLWLLIIAIIIILCIIFAACVVKRVKKKQQNKTNATIIDNNRILLVSSSDDKNNSHQLTKDGGVILAYDSGTVVQSTLATNDNKKTHLNGFQNDKRNNSAKNKTMLRNQLISTPITYYVNGEVHPAKINGDISYKKTPNRVLPPVEKFDRPDVHVLDNVSAISLDEFWQKIDSNKVKVITVAESPPNEDSQILL